MTCCIGITNNDEMMHATCTTRQQIHDFARTQAQLAPGLFSTGSNLALPVLKTLKNLCRH